MKGMKKIIILLLCLKLVHSSTAIALQDINPEKSPVQEEEGTLSLQEINSQTTLTEKDTLTHNNGIFSNVDNAQGPAPTPLVIMGAEFCPSHGLKYVKRCGQCSECPAGDCEWFNIKTCKCILKFKCAAKVASFILQVIFNR
ncbi:unnamed protein product [Meganyctiphanes norvegica]|uniref:Uncharacterized protein n=1 Tax=Meganyctiphanes norvegica TaxID=48144 RepID=A0AAV2SAL4_MEGNR